MVAFHPDGIGLGGCVIVVGGRTGKVCEGKVGLSITEAVVYEGDLLSVQRTGSPQPIQHIRADLPVSGISAQGQHGQRRRLKGGVKDRLRESLHLGKTLREGREGKGFPLVSNGCGCRRRGIHGGLL